MYDIQEYQIKSAICLSALAIGMAPVSAWAQGVEESSNAGMGEIVVTARKTNERLQDVPIAITTRTGEQLEQAGVATTGDLSRLVPGLLISQSTANAQPVLRGVGVSAAGAGNDPNLAIYYDGVYSGTQGSLIQNLASISSIEVLKGPQGTLFGRNATAGAVLVHTRNPEFTATGNVSAETGIYDSERGASWVAKAFVTGPLTDTIAASLAASYRGGNGYLRDLVTGEKCCTQKYANFRGKLLLAPSDDISLILSAWYNYRNDPMAGNGTNRSGKGLAASLMAAGVLPPDIIIPRGPYDVAFDGPNTIKNEDGGASLRAELKLDGLTLTSITAYQKRQTWIDSDADISTAPLVTVVTTQPSRTFTQEFNLGSGSDGPLSWVAGAFYYYDKSNAYLIINSGPNLHTLIKTDAYALFSEANYEVLPRLILTAGLRYSKEDKIFYGTPDDDNVAMVRINDVSYDSFTPRATVAYKFSKNTMMYATYSKGFKSGIFSSTELSGIPVKPEKLDSYEIGVKTSGAGYTLNLAAFYYDYTNLQVSSFDGVAVRVANAANAEIYGLEAEGNVRLSRDFSVSGNFSYLPRARYESFPGAVVVIVDPADLNNLLQTNMDVSGARLPRSPKFSASISPSLEKQLRSGTLDASVNFYYSSGYVHEPTGRIKVGDYATIGGQIGWTFGDSGVRAYLWGRNLTDAKVQSGYVAINTTDWGTYDPPRQLGIGVEAKF